jgi:2-polyprenyl-6-methoxyphenol hydroxylase-like FAD-dependent oxidoreductase
MSVQKALIIGGGISGAAGAAWGRRGIDVDVIEIKEKLGDIGGVGLSLMSNASKALATIDAAQACVEAGMPADVGVRLSPPPPVASARKADVAGINRGLTRGLPPHPDE